MSRDKILNSLLSYRLKLINWIFPNYYGNEEPCTLDMQPVLTDNFFQLDESVWRIGQPWGSFHPGYPIQYYGKDSVKIGEIGLELDHRYSPSLEEHYSLVKPVLVPYSVGLITSVQHFRYGFFKFKITLPYGIGLWPAVWLTGVDSWPPEIDIIEAYSDDIGLYKNKYETNIHYEIYPNNKSLGALAHPIDSHELSVSCWWAKDFIKIYYNGLLVRVIKDKKILEWFENQKMMIVLNNGIREDYLHMHPKIENISLSKFIIQSVSIWQ